MLQSCVGNKKSFRHLQKKERRHLQKRKKEDICKKRERRHLRGLSSPSLTQCRLAGHLSRQTVRLFSNGDRPHIVSHLLENLNSIFSNGWNTNYLQEIQEPCVFDLTFNIDVLPKAEYVARAFISIAKR